MNAKATRVEGIIDLLYQALETEQGGIKIYETAIACAVNDDLREEWTEYLEETRTHERVLIGVLESLGLEPTQETPGRAVVRLIGESLVAAMRQAQASATPEQAELVACEAPHHLSVVFTSPDGPWPLTATLAEMAGGGTELVFVHRLAEPYDATGVGPGWHYYLDRLAAAVSASPMPTMDDWPAYEPLGPKYPLPN